MCIETDFRIMIRMLNTGCPKKCTTFVLFIVSIVSNTASSDLYQKIASFMEIY